MDGGAWWATVYGVAESDTAEATCYQILKPMPQSRCYYHDFPDEKSENSRRVNHEAKSAELMKNVARILILFQVRI